MLSILQPMLSLLSDWEGLSHSLNLSWSTICLLNSVLYPLWPQGRGFILIILIQDSLRFQGRAKRVGPWLLCFTTLWYYTTCYSYFMGPTEPTRSHLFWKVPVKLSYCSRHVLNKGSCAKLPTGFFFLIGV